MHIATEFYAMRTVFEHVAQKLGENTTEFLST
jgi:hypothetical protein